MVIEKNAIYYSACHININLQTTNLMYMYYKRAMIAQYLIVK